MSQLLGTFLTKDPTMSNPMTDYQTEISRVLLGLGAGLALSTAAMAEPAAPANVDFTPSVTGSVSVEVESDHVIDADDSTAKISDTYATVDAALTAQISRSLSLNAAMTFEPVLDATDDRFFEDHGAYIGELYARYDADWGAAVGGKFAPAFGIAWDAAPGLYGSSFAEDYELSEQIGLGVELPLGEGEGAPTLTLASFFADTTALSNSIFQDRGRLKKSDGGAGNTESLENVAATLSGEIAQTGYALGVRRLAAGEGDPEDEYGVSFALTRGITIGDGELTALGEIAWFKNQGGADADALYGTAGLAYGFGDFTASAVYSLRDVDGADLDHLATASLEYDAGHGFGLGMGYFLTETGGDTTHGVGVLASYGYEF
ncbi:MAG: hypothetical protein MRY63_07330 [Neomegalonema sp.]|nr:hypothetical protein [Neomegalonema sp.]